MFKRRHQITEPLADISIIERARAKINAERDYHADEIKYFESIIADATDKLTHHQAAHAAYDAIASRIAPTIIADAGWPSSIEIAEYPHATDLEAIDAEIDKAVNELKAAPRPKRSKPGVI